MQRFGGPPLPAGGATEAHPGLLRGQRGRTDAELLLSRQRPASALVGGEADAGRSSGTDRQEGD